MSEQPAVAATPTLGNAVTTIPDGGGGIVPLTKRIGHCGMGG